MSNLMVSDWIRITRQHCQGNSGHPINVLQAQKTAADPTATLTYPITGAQIGQTVEIGWVEYSIMAIDLGAKTLELEPVIVGTAVDHNAGTRVTFTPRFPARMVLDELNAELNALSAPGNAIYKLRTVNAVGGVMDAPDDAVTILAAWDDGTDTTELHHHPPARWRIGDDPDGVRLVGPHDVDFMVFGCTFSPVSYTADADVSGTGIVNTAEDIPPLGAALRLLAGRESQRNLADTQGQTRRAAEVPAGAMTGALRNLDALRRRRILEECARYQQRYGLQLHERI